jgi:hypothetical protein
MRRIIEAIGATLAITAIIAASAATASVARQQTPSPDMVGLGGRLGSGPGLEGLRGDPKTGDASGGFIYRKGRYTPLDGVEGLITTHHSINNRGQTTGAYARNALDASDPDPGGFVRKRSGRYERFDAVPGLSTLPLDINDRGTTIGWYGSFETGEVGSFLRRAGGDVTAVELPDAQQTALLGTNNRGAMVGAYADAEGKFRAFVLERGRVTRWFPPAPRTTRTPPTCSPMTSTTEVRSSAATPTPTGPTTGSVTTRGGSQASIHPALPTSPSGRRRAPSASTTAARS